jgi:hypothetical protein
MEMCSWEDESALVQRVQGPVGLMLLDSYHAVCVCVRLLYQCCLDEAVADEEAAEEEAADEEGKGQH